MPTVFAEVPIRPEKTLPSWRSSCKGWGNFPLRDSESQAIQTHHPSKQRVHPPKMDAGGYWDLKGHVEKTGPVSPQDIHSDESGPETVLHLQKYIIASIRSCLGSYTQELNINCVVYPL